MSSYRQIFYHLIFCTKDRAPVLPLAHCDALYRYLWGFVKNKNCVLYRVNGMEEHLHLLTDLHPSLALADFMRDMKTASALWMKRHPHFGAFQGWADGYGALTYAFRDKETVVNYIKNQRKHHKAVSFLDEYKKLLTEHGLAVDERYFP
jgi:REP element-mobilizing transposase RayT